jgi:hypothetical protein
MTVLARGAKQVRSLERAIAGTPPKAGSTASRAWLERHMAERFKQQQTRLTETSRMAERWRELLFKDVHKDDARLKRLKEQAKAQLEKRKKRKIERPKRLEIEPRFIVGSSFLLKAPPYDGAWQWANVSNAQAQSDASRGTCDLKVQSFGNGNREVAAGFFAWFFAPEDNPMQRFAALLQYSDDWWDDASGYVAHNDLRTRLWVWGQTENRWVVQSEMSPSWSDGVGWFESHGNDPGGDSGTISNETFFPASANNLYQAWVWSDASAYADGGSFGSADSSIQFDSVVPFMVFGSL